MPKTGWGAHDPHGPCVPPWRLLGSGEEGALSLLIPLAVRSSRTWPSGGEDTLGVQHRCPRARGSWLVDAGEVWSRFSDPGGHHMTPSSKSQSQEQPSTSRSPLHPEGRSPVIPSPAQRLSVAPDSLGIDAKVPAVACSRALASAVLAVCTGHTHTLFIPHPVRPCCPHLSTHWRHPPPTAATLLLAVSPTRSHLAPQPEAGAVAG